LQVSIILAKVARVIQSSFLTSDFYRSVDEKITVSVSIFTDIDVVPIIQFL